MKYKKRKQITKIRYRNRIRIFSKYFSKLEKPFPFELEFSIFSSCLKFFLFQAFAILEFLHYNRNTHTQINEKMADLDQQSLESSGGVVLSSVFQI